MGDPIQRSGLTPIAPSSLRPLAKPAPAPAAKPSSAPTDQIKTTAGRQGSVPATLTATDGLPVATADVTVDANGRILGADGRPYGGTELFYDAASDQVLDSTRHPVDQSQIGNRTHHAQAATPLSAAAHGHPQSGIMLDEHNHLVTPDGKPYQGRQLTYDAKSDRVLDDRGRAVDPKTLPEWASNRTADPNDAKLVQRIRVGAAVATGVARGGVEAAWYRRSLSIARSGPVTGFAAPVRNAVRGRVLPTLMLAADGYGVYRNVTNWNSAGNTRKWDDALRIAGNGLSAAGDVMALKRGDITHALAAHVAGIVVATAGRLANDQE